MSNAKKPPRPVWLDPEEYPPPRGNKLHLLTKLGIAIMGHWSDEDCQAWMPLADVPNSIKDKRRNAFADAIRGAN